MFRTDTLWNGAFRTGAFKHWRTRLRYHSISTSIFATLAVLVALVVTIFLVIAGQALNHRADASQNLALIDVYRDLLIAKEHIRVEQGAVSAALSNPHPADARMRNYIDRSHRQADQDFRNIMGKLARGEFQRISPDLPAMALKYRTFDTVFQRAWQDIQRPGEDRQSDISLTWPAQGAVLVGAMEIETTRLAKRIQNADSMVGEMSKISGLAWALRDAAGVDRRHVGIAIDKGGVLDPADRLIFAEADGRIDAPWVLLGYDMKLPDTPAALKNSYDGARTQYFGSLQVQRKSIIDALVHGRPTNLTQIQWWRLSEPALASIAAISTTALDMMHDHVAKQMASAERNVYLSLASMAAVVGFVLLVSLVIALRVIRPLSAITDGIQAVAAGDLKCEIPFVTQDDEIGHLAKALQMFRNNAVDKRRLESELVRNRIAKNAAEASNKARAQFFANMSHELRTPLNAIIGFSELMRQKMFGPLDGRYEEYAHLINSSGQHLLDLVSDILDISKMEAGKFVLDFQAMDLIKALNDSMRMVEKRALDNGIKLFRDAPEELSLTADERAVKQILLNILSNAVKFTPRGGEVRVAISLSGQQVRISVQDTGIGIPAEALSRLGRAFEQVSNDPMLAREGSGLGLAMVRSLVDLHGGTLTINSQMDVGTTVVAEIPQVRDRKAAAA